MASTDETPTVSNIVLGPPTLGQGQSGVMASLDVISPNVDVISISCFGNLEGTDGNVSFEINLDLEQGGNVRNGRWRGTTNLPTYMPDGNYSVGYSINKQGLYPNSWRQIASGEMGIIRLQRSSIADNEPPTIIAAEVQPLLIRGPSNIDSNFQVSARISDNVGVVLVSDFSDDGVLYESGGSFYMSPEQANNNPQSGTWLGILGVHPFVANGEYNIKVYAFDAAGNMAISRDNLVVTVQRSPYPYIYPRSVNIEPSTLGVGQSVIALSVRVRDPIGRGVERVSASIFYYSGNNRHQIGNTVQLSHSNTATDTMTWSGIFTFPADVADGEYRVNFTAINLDGNSSINEIATVRLGRHDSSPGHTPTSGESQVIVTCNGPVKIESTHLESKKCQIRISTLGPITIECDEIEHEKK